MRSAYAMYNACLRTAQQAYQEGKTEQTRILLYKAFDLAMSEVEGAPTVTEIERWGVRLQWAGKLRKWLQESEAS